MQRKYNIGDIIESPGMYENDKIWGIVIKRKKNNIIVRWIWKQLERDYAVARITSFDEKKEQHLVKVYSET